MKKLCVSALLCALVWCAAYFSARPHDVFEFTTTLGRMYLSQQAAESFGSRQSALDGNGSYTGAVVETFSFDLPPGSFSFFLNGSADGNAVFELYSPRYAGDDNSAGRVFAQTPVSDSDVTCINFNNSETIRGARLRVVRTDPEGSVSVSSITADGGALYNDAAAIAFFAAITTASALCFLHRRRDQLRSGDYGSAAAVVVCALSALAGAAPIFRLALPSGHDTIFHLSRIEGVAEGLRSGQLSVRINPAMLFGYGYADTIMYPPTFLYFPAVLRLLGVSPIVSYQIFILGINSLTAGLSYACFKRLFGRRDLGLLASLAYTLCLYRLICVFTRAAVGELLAIAFLPAVLLGMYTVFFGNARRGSRALTLGFLGIANSHVLTLEMAAIFCAVFALFNVKRLFERERLATLLRSAGITVLLSLWLLVPMLDIGTSGLVVTHYTPTIAEDAVYPAELFATFVDSLGLSGEASLVYTAMPLTVGGILGIGALMLLFFKFFVPVRTGEERRLERLGMGSLLLSLLALYVASTLFPWSYIANIPVIGGVLAAVQFPWRYLGIASLLLVTATVAGVSRLLGYTGKRRLVLFFIAVALAASVSPYIDSYMQNTEQTAVLQDKYSSMHLYYIGGQEYLRYGTNKAELDSRGPAASAKGAVITGFSKEYLDISFSYERASASGAYAELPLYYYNGYRAEDENGEPLAVTEGTNGVVRVALPAGSGTVSVGYAPPVYYRAAEAVSLLTLLALIAQKLPRRPIKRKEHANA